MELLVLLLGFEDNVDGGKTEGFEDCRDEEVDNGFGLEDDIEEELLARAGGCLVSSLRIFSLGCSIRLSTD